MKDIVERVLKVTDHIINTKDTIRKTASIFKVSKSTIHKDVKDRLMNIDINKYNKVQEIIKEHLETRHILGGESTKKKYEKLKLTRKR